MKEIPISTYLVRVKKCFPLNREPVYRVQYKTRSWYRRWQYHIKDIRSTVDWNVFETENYDLALVEAKMVHDYLNEKDDRRRYTYIS